MLYVILHCSTCIISRRIRAVKGKGKDDPLLAKQTRRGERRQKHSSNHSGPRRENGVGGQRHAPASLTPGDPVPLYRRLGGARGRCGLVHGIESHLGSNFGPIGPKRVAIPTEMLNPPNQTCRQEYAGVASQIRPRPFLPVPFQSTTQLSP